METFVLYELYIRLRSIRKSRQPWKGGGGRGFLKKMMGDYLRGAEKSLKMLTVFMVAQTVVKINVTLYILTGL